MPLNCTRSSNRAIFSACGIPSKMRNMKIRMAMSSTKKLTTTWSGRASFRFWHFCQLQVLVGRGSNQAHTCKPSLKGLDCVNSRVHYVSHPDWFLTHAGAMCSAILSSFVFSAWPIRLHVTRLRVLRQMQASALPVFESRNMRRVGAKMNQTM
jgi:hypothetical protein